MKQVAVDTLAFVDVDFDPRYEYGACVNISGGVMYTYAKYKALTSR